ncbi:MAG: hypothetical protein ACJ79S_22425 [Gemmatimonadaceae bacterium]
MFSSAVGAALLGCGAERIATPGAAPVPAEVVQAAREAGRDGVVEMLEVRDRRTGRVLKRTAAFRGSPGGVSGRASRAAAPRGAAASALGSAPADDPNPYWVLLPRHTMTPATVRAQTGTDTAMTFSFNTFCTYGGQQHQMTFTVDTLTISAVANTGGHDAAGHPQPKPTSRTDRTSGPSDATGEWPFTYFTDETAGDEHFVLRYTVDDPSQPSNCQGTSTSGTYVFAKRWPGLVRIPEGGGLVYGDITSAHFDIFYAAPEVAARLPAVVRSYQRMYPGASLRLTGASLLYGGLEDVNNDWRRPHNRHRIGTDVDLNAAPGGGGHAKLEQIRDACLRNFFPSVNIEANHMHCYGFYPYTDQRPVRGP